MAAVEGARVAEVRLCLRRLQCFTAQPCRIVGMMSSEHCGVGFCDFAAQLKVKETEGSNGGRGGACMCALQLREHDLSTSKYRKAALPKFTPYEMLLSQ